MSIRSWLKKGLRGLGNGNGHFPPRLRPSEVALVRVLEAAGEDWETIWYKAQDRLRGYNQNVSSLVAQERQLRATAESKREATTREVMGRRETEVADAKRVFEERVRRAEATAKTDLNQIEQEYTAAFIKASSLAADASSMAFAADQLSRIFDNLPAALKIDPREEPTAA